MASFHRVFGHPQYGGNGEELTPREFTLQHTDYKSVGAYRKFSGDNACNPTRGSESVRTTRPGTLIATSQTGTTTQLRRKRSNISSLMTSSWRPWRLSERRRLPLPGSNREILGVKELRLTPQGVVRCLRKRSLNETLKKCCQKRLKAPPDVSGCHLNKHRLINWLGALVNETHLDHGNPQAVLPPKISPKLPESDYAVCTHRSPRWKALI